MSQNLLLLVATNIQPGGLPHQSATGSSDLQAILQIAFAVIGAFAVLVITLSGMRYITSGGNPEKTAKAKNGIVYSLVGLVVAISAEAIVTFVIKRL